MFAVEGTLKGHDAVCNLVLDDTEEFLRGNSPPYTAVLGSVVRQGPIGQWGSSYPQAQRGVKQVYRNALFDVIYFWAGAVVPNHPNLLFRCTMLYREGLDGAKRLMVAGYQLAA